MEKVKQKDLILYSGLIILGLAAPYLFSAFKVQLTYLCVLIVLAMTWNLQGGEMGYNTFGNILFYGLGNLPAVALSGMGLGLFEEFADYILGTEFRIGSVFLLLVLILVYRRFKLSRKREYLK